MIHLLARMFVLAVLAFIWYGFIMAVAHAAPPPCSTAEGIAAQLSGRYHEAPMAQGLASSGAVMQLWVSRDRSTWSLTFALADGRVCLMSVGESLELLPWSLPKGTAEEK